MNSLDPDETAIVSACIPVLNEAHHLPRLLLQLQAQRGVVLDIVVADGGSIDGSADALPPNVRVVTSARGRGAQMNAAARAARGDWLLFLHADTQLSEPWLLANAVDALNTAQARCGHDRVAGHFPLRFARARAGCSLLFRYMEAKTELNRAGTINGDQGMLLSRRFFGSLGGFDETRPLLEDQDLAARVFDTGRWITLPGPLTTSARRFESLGALRVYTFMALIMAAWATGNSAFVQQVPVLYQRRRPDGRLSMRAVMTAWRCTQRGRLRPLVRYAASNAWQVFFFIAVVVGARPNRYSRRRSPAARESARAARR